VFRHDGKILSADRTRRKLKEGTGVFFIQGPIIEPDVCCVSHRDDVDDLGQNGRDLERQVLTRPCACTCSGGC
jgi:hypothetical protein